jgi:replication initiation and membrane attachment protein
MLTNSLPNTIIKNGIRDIINEYKTTKGAINCLMEFSFLKNGGKVIVNYILKIAQTLHNDNIHSAQEVMAFLKGANKTAKQTRTHQTQGQKSNIQTIASSKMEFEKFDFKQYENDELTDNDILVIANNM